MPFSSDALQSGALGVLALVCVGGLRLGRQLVLELRELRRTQERLASLLIITADPKIEEYARALSQRPEKDPNA